MSGFMHTSADVTDASLTRRTLVMGVLNATPDSFYTPSTILDPDSAAVRAREMANNGADIIDIGGESSRPGAAPTGLEEELARVLPVFESLEGSGLRLSIDTYRAEAARAALARGASMVNDITALGGDAEMAGVVAESGAECVLMHMQGTPETMQVGPQYADLMDELCAFFEERIAYAVDQGIAEEKVWIDPGFGFGKTVEHNLTILRRLNELGKFGRPVLIGTSNKSTIGAVLDASPGERAEGTAATVAVAVWNGAAGVRVHDVKAMARVARMCDAIAGRISVDG